jgi:putative Mg2+ transporter-C (MgtC) family protein
MQEELFAALREMSEPSARMAAAMILGGMIGLNRVMNAKPAGIRIHALVALSTALLSYAALDLPGEAAAARVIQGLLAGLGFLGAGVILRDHAADNPRRIYHLTTATSIWMAAALGVVCGIGMIGAAVAATIGALVVLTLAIRLDRKLFALFGNEDDRGDPVS